MGLFNSFLNSYSIGEPVSIIFPGQQNVVVKQWRFRLRNLLRGHYTIWKYFKYINSKTFGIYRPVKPQYSEGKLVLLTNYVEPGNYFDSKGLLYQFVATRPGIFLYESGTNPEKQIQMGMYGVVLIRPVGYNLPGHSNYKTVYGASTRSKYDVEKILVLGEFDSNMHENITPNVYYDMLKFNPECWVINGRAFPDTLNDNDNSTQPYGSEINCKVGQRVLLRIINAGYHNHTFYLGGLNGRVVAEDSFSLFSQIDTTYEKMGVTLGPGQSVDIILTPTILGEFYLYDGGYNHLVNNDQFPGGMMTRLKVFP